MDCVKNTHFNCLFEKDTYLGNVPCNTDYTNKIKTIIIERESE